jgi:hypothetical protein
MISPIAHSAAQKIVPVIADGDIEVAPNIHRFANRTLFILIKATLLQDLHEMSEYSLT